MTVSAWITSFQAPSYGFLGVQCLDASGATVSSWSYANTTLSSPTRVSVTVTPPAAAAWVTISAISVGVVAGLAATWTSDLRPYGPPLGAPRVVSDDDWSDALLWVLDQPYRSVDLSFKEVG